MGNLHNHHHHHDQSDTKRLGLAFFLNVSFTIIELIGGMLTQSLAILSDALHDLGDSTSLGLAWYFQKVAKKGRDKKYSYGYKRFSLLGALINGIILVIGSIFILIEAIPRITNPQPSHAEGMILLALLGIAVNGFAAFKLKNGSSLNEKVVSLHLWEDVLGWVAVLVGGIIIYVTDWYQIDPILSIGITLYILFSVVKHLRSTSKIILQGIPEHIDPKEVEQNLVDLPTVASIHDLHIWSLDGERTILTVHVVKISEYNYSNETVKRQVVNEMKKMGIDHCTIQIEENEEDCDLLEC